MHRRAEGHPPRRRLGRAAPVGLDLPRPDGRLLPARAAFRAAQPAREPAGRLPERHDRVRDLLQRRAAGLRHQRSGAGPRDRPPRAGASGGTALHPVQRPARRCGRDDLRHRPDPRWPVHLPPDEPSRHPLRDHRLGLRSRAHVAAAEYARDLRPAVLEQLVQVRDGKDAVAGAVQHQYRAARMVEESACDERQRRRGVDPVRLRRASAETRARDSASSNGYSPSRAERIHSSSNA